MKKRKFGKVLRTIITVTALAEAVGGKKFMKQTSKRLSVLDQEAVIEVWLGVHNTLNPREAVRTGNLAFERSAIVKKECMRIIDKLLEQPERPDLDERIERIIERKVKHTTSDISDIHGSN